MALEKTTSLLSFKGNILERKGMLGNLSALPQFVQKTKNKSSELEQTQTFWNEKPAKKLYVYYQMI